MHTLKKFLQGCIMHCNYWLKVPTVEYTYPAGKGTSPENNSNLVYYTRIRKRSRRTYSLRW